MFHMGEIRRPPERAKESPPVDERDMMGDNQRKHKKAIGRGHLS
jgi:hypothetical protein